MASDRDDSHQHTGVVHLNGQNYSYWNYVLKNLLKGKRMHAYVFEPLISSKLENMKRSHLFGEWHLTVFFHIKI
jgi:hypothetical protein